MEKKRHTVITYGTYDILHVGHIRLFKRIKGMCDTLIVAVSTDEFNIKKGKKTLIPYAQRVEVIESLKYVDRVIEEKSWNQKKDDIIKYEVDEFVMGDDWLGKFDDLSKYCKVSYLKRTDNISSSELKLSIGSVVSLSNLDSSTATDVLKQFLIDVK